MRESSLKPILIDHLLEKLSKTSILGTEVPYASGQRRADVVVIGKKFIHAYEVKSEYDGLARLNGQIKDSKLAFDYTTLVVSKRIGDTIKRLVDRSVGIIEVDTEHRRLKVVRDGEQKKRLDKFFLSTFLWREDLIKGLEGKNISVDRRKDTNFIRKKLVTSSTIDELHSLSLLRLRERYIERFNIFMQERGEVTHPDDLRALSISSQDIE